MVDTLKVPQCAELTIGWHRPTNRLEEDSRFQEAGPRFTDSQGIDVEDSHSLLRTTSHRVSRERASKKPGYIGASWPLEVNILSATVLQAQRLVKSPHLV
ncbi:hypothetical protein OUZ56_008651 [Daphnia magna]|uniref:Uncharacterized protein n=1 Tax=Daphnia magna TaxID=35525 RepID=A0ABR0ADR4_9CRUS|nr:hypothetical protein OUZ56_008651 [Daphnia magna]